VTPTVPHILIVNPWIHDFAAYDFWAKPLGLLSLGAILRRAGCCVSYLDCLDRFHPKMTPETVPGETYKRHGRGPYLKTTLMRPAGLEDVPRTYSRYGILPEWFEEDIKRLKPPDLVLVTSLMTYWYPGVKETIGHIKTVWPKVPLVLGGVYATLCHEHAVVNSGADEVHSGAADADIFSIVYRHTGWQPDAASDVINLIDLDSYPYPAFDLQSRISYMPLLTSRGCPMKCEYCAASRLQPIRLERSPDSVLQEIKYWHFQHNVVDFALYDDAFLYRPEQHALPLLEGIVKSGLKLRFHTPNALHLRWISAQVAKLMFAAGFKTIRLGLETALFDEGERHDQKVTHSQFKAAINHLRAAGFKKETLGAYLLVGLPGQEETSVLASFNMVHKVGVTPIPAYYTPIPHTLLWDKAQAASRYDLEADPVFTNNAILPCQKDPFSWDALNRFKHFAQNQC
jgi:radical SAM superfamily enzyme YgiQ (UPF0313 family)